MTFGIYACAVFGTRDLVPLDVKILEGNACI